MSFWEGIKAGTFTLPANQSNVAVTFPDPFPPNQTYVIICTPNYQTAFWMTSVTSTGFTFNAGTTNAYDQTMNYFAYME